MATNVFLGSDGAVYHQPCWRALEYRGVRGHRTAQFYCGSCRDLVALSLRDLAGIPLSAPPAVTRPGIEATLAGAGLDR
jgi:hypothetical protein